PGPWEANGGTVARMNTYSPGDVSLLGLGAMGAPMAQALVDADLEPWLWNRTAAKTERFADSAARIASTPAEAARPVTLTMFADLPDLEGLLDGTHGLLQGWQSAGVDRPLLVVMGTVSPAGVCRLGESLAEHGVRVMDAPVSGGVAGARERRLSIMVGGEAADVSAVEPLLRLLGTTVHHVGALGAGQTAKTCNQIIVAATMAGVSEAFYLARSAGVRPEALLDILSGGLAA